MSLRKLNKLLCFLEKELLVLLFKINPKVAIVICKLVFLKFNKYVNKVHFYDLHQIKWPLTSSNHGSETPALPN